MAIAKLADQHDYVGRLNTRLGGVVAAIVAVAAAMFPSIRDGNIRVVVGGLLLSSLIEATRASFVSFWNDAPDPHQFAMYAGDDPDYMKEVALPAVLAAFDFNQPRLTPKGQVLELRDHLSRRSCRPNCLVAYGWRLEVRAMSDEEGPSPVAPSDQTPSTPTDGSPSAPGPSYTPGAVVEDLIMTIERGLQVVQEPPPSYEHKGSDQADSD